MKHIIFHLPTIIDICDFKTVFQTFSQTVYLKTAATNKKTKLKSKLFPFFLYVCKNSRDVCIHFVTILIAF